ncbi:hypothetical protein [Oleiagrimonas soli]|uniref:Late embryogenesis abundant protein LEA-2 subgroup domain-containing protein n=1 Tax=Oleiagrimonas soli TaxID=1543381 RepID=A0A099CTP8_9GAMM|nr:hypothetical protein [Oleiagrimonas soli]KGI76987.1 hypothetical protein LF63_0111985 [Oleiagrimonas soli]MBB6185505.1 hypothetical protein [Oleiagrimonas soli]
MKRVLSVATLIVAIVALSACGPTRKSVFPPLVSIQQLHVGADGQWRMQLRIQNNSYDGVKFRAVNLDMKLHGADAGRIDQAIDLDIPALSVDVADVRITPSPTAARLLAGNAVRYQLEGTATGTPEQDKKPRTFKVKSGDTWLSPVPGIANTWR